MKQFPKTPRLWGATDGEPVTLDEWRSNFAAWLRALDWFLTHCDRGEEDAKRARKTAPSTSLLRAPDALEVSSATRATIWRLRGLFGSEPQEARAFDFGDVASFPLWLDFLNEHRTRRSAWRRFEQRHGASEVL